MDKLILASQSPRRKQLLEQAGIEFEALSPDVDETPPAGMPAGEVPEHLSRVKAATVAALRPERTVLAADTVVLLGEEILGKPRDIADAKSMLRRLSGRTHNVVTGVTIQKGDQVNSFSVVTRVHFLPLEEAEIEHFVEQYRPLDKAGAYAIQEWIGLRGIEGINGDYYNVMGLPVSRVVPELALLRSK